MTRVAIIAVVLVAASSMRAQEPMATPTVFTAAQAAAGRTAYRSVCVNCHLEALTGRKEPGERPPVSSMSADMQKEVLALIGKAPALAGPQFMARWGERTTTDLSERIKVAMNGFPPKDASENTSLDLAAYFLRASGARPGTEALTARTAVIIKTTVPAETAPARH